MNAQAGKTAWIEDTIALYGGTIKFLLGLTVALLSLFLYLHYPAQEAVLSNQEAAQTRQLEATRDEIANISLQISDQITLDKVEEYARAKGLQFGANVHQRFIGAEEGNNQTAMRR